MMPGAGQPHRQIAQQGPRFAGVSPVSRLCGVRKRLPEASGRLAGLRSEPALFKRAYEQ